MHEFDPKILLNEITALNQRLKRIEEHLFETQPTPAVAAPVDIIDESVPPVPAVAQKKSGNFLGYVGVGCLLLAMVLLIKFSIDSGWLTPVRQIILAIMFGVSLIFMPALSNLKDIGYLSLMPAGGVVTLHLVVYGSVFIHKLISPAFGIGMISAIGFVSLNLLKRYEHATYVVLSVVGTYLGALFLSDSFTNLYAFAGFMIAWDIIFCAYGIRIQNRNLISFPAGFALLIVGALTFNSSKSDFYLQLAALQFCQGLIFSIATMIYSVKNNEPLTKNETVQLFPVFLFLYGHVFYILDSVNPHYATIFAVSFSALLFGLLTFSESKSQDKEFQSKNGIYSFITIMLAHSIFFVVMNDISQMIFVLLLTIFGVFGPSRKETIYKGVQAIVFVMIGYVLLKVTFGEIQAERVYLILFGLIFGFSILYYALEKFKGTDNRGIVLALAHIQTLLAISRLDVFIPDFSEAPIGILYGSAVLFIGYRKNSRQIAKSAIIPLSLCLFSFLIEDFGKLGNGERIISLIIMGGLIYVGGYFYRKIEE